MSIYYDYETMELAQKNGDVARPVSIGWGDSNGNTKQYYISPDAYGVNSKELYNQNIKGGWRSEYQKAYETHGVNSKQLTGEMPRPKGTGLIRTQSELTDMYDEMLGLVEVRKKEKSHSASLPGNAKRSGNIKNNLGREANELVGFNNNNFDDHILTKQVSEFGSKKAKLKLARLEKNDIRKEAFNVLASPGTVFESFKEEFQKATGFATTNEDLAKFFNIELDSSKLHDAEYDISVSRKIRESIHELNAKYDLLDTATTKEQTEEVLDSIRSRFGGQAINAPMTQTKIKAVKQKGIDLTDIQTIFEPIQEIDNNPSKGYNSKVIDFMKTASATVKKGSSVLNQKGFTYRRQAGAAGIVAGAIAINSMFGSNQEEQNNKLETINEKINGSKGQYLKY